MRTSLGGIPVVIPKVFEKFTFTKVLGRGSYAIVLHAIDTETNRPYAVKIISKQFLIDHNEVTHFEHEVTIFSSLDHPRVVKFYKLLHDDQLIYLVIEYCELGTMETAILKQQGCGEFHAAHFVQQVLQGIHYLHFRGIAHRDLKPQNILVDHGFNLKLADFGFAINVDSGLRSTRCGSPVFAAPEVIAGQTYDPKCADMWSLGVIVFLLATGNLPWENVTNAATLFFDIQTAKYHIPENLSKNFANFIGGLMQPQPKLRFTAEQALCHPWVQQRSLNVVTSYSSSGSKRPAPAGLIRPICDSIEFMSIVGRRGSHITRRALPVPIPTFDPGSPENAEIEGVNQVGRETSME
jgi:5'-AMP-activated protein kinase catalytic alpha subunit